MQQKYYEILYQELRSWNLSKFTQVLKYMYIFSSSIFILDSFLLLSYQDIVCFYFYYISAICSSYFEHQFIYKTYYQLLQYDCYKLKLPNYNV